MTSTLDTKKLSNFDIFEKKRNSSKSLFKFVRTFVIFGNCKKHTVRVTRAESSAIYFGAAWDVTRPKQKVVENLVTVLKQLLPTDALDPRSLVSNSARQKQQQPQ
jgi:hypothetical protein